MKDRFEIKIVPSVSNRDAAAFGNADDANGEPFAYGEARLTQGRLNGPMIPRLSLSTGGDRVV